MDTLSGTVLCKVVICLQVRNPSSDKCLDTLGKKDDAPLGLYECHGQGGNQVRMHNKS